MTRRTGSSQPRAPHPALQRLRAHVGAWERLAERTPSGARTTLEWLEGGAFLVQHTTAESIPPDAPPEAREWMARSPHPVVTIIGLDDARGSFTQLYADARGAFRVYQMTFDGAIWTLWRDAPGFSQRFQGTAGDDGITGRWERSSDGSRWEHDFDLTYARIGR